MSSTGTTPEVAVPNTNAGDVCPYWSPDGQWIYFMKQYTAGTFRMHNIYRIKRDGTSLTQITSLPNTDTLGMSLVITSNGKWGVVPARIGGVTGLYKFRMDNASLQTKGYLIKAFPHIRSVENIWVGNADAVTEPTTVHELNADLAGIYPNPATTTIKVSLKRSGTYSLFGYNAMGQLCFLKEIGQSQKIDISHLTTGTYILQLKEAGTANIQTFSLTKE